MEDDLRRLVDAEWAARFGLAPEALHCHGVHVVAADIGANDAMSFLLEDVCIIVVGADDLESAWASVAGLSAHEAFVPDTLTRILGPEAQIDGPSLHSYVDEDAFSGSIDPAVTRTPGSDPSLLAFLKASDINEWAESGFPLDPHGTDSETTRFWVAAERGAVVAAGNMTEWRGLPADVGLLTHPEARGRGLATRVAATMVGSMLPTIKVARYRALATNQASLAVARALGFRSYGQNYRARRPKA